MHGADTAFNSYGNYGIKGVAAPTNEPPGRYQACYWTDKSGNFWLFGGVVDKLMANDMWKFDVRTNMWTWMSGAITNPNGVTGTKGIPSVNNYPSARGYGANCWTDNNGDPWLYGGGGGYNDLWKYHIATNEWTWVNGSQTIVGPVYGTMGVAAASNTPGILAECKSAWVDAANNLWMFGGQDSSGTSSNTLWKYDISADKWTWMNGTNIPGAPGNYGTYRVETATNQPPARFSYTRWKDSAGDMYIFGGVSTLMTEKTFNDVWRYRPSVNKWTWVSGTNIVSDSGKYPPLYCKFYDNYFPAARLENQTAFSTNPCTKAFWSFGGFVGMSDGSGIYDDLWLFSTDSLRWSLMSGTKIINFMGRFGKKGVPNAANAPPAKGGQCMWVDKHNNLWVFGGFDSAYHTRNDLWRFVPDTNCINSSALFGEQLVAPDTALCLGQSTVLNIGKHKSVRYTPTTFVTPNSDTTKLTFSPSRTTKYSVIVLGGACGVDDSVSFTINVFLRDSIKLKPPVPLALCLADTARMSVNPTWNISVLPDSAVKYQPMGSNYILFYPGANSTYIVTATSSAACAGKPDTLKFNLTNDGHTRHMSLMTDTVLCKGDTAIYIANPKPDIWLLKPFRAVEVSRDSSTFRFYPSVTTSYQLIGIQQSGCNPHDTLNFTLHRSQLQARLSLTPKQTDLTEPVFELTNTSIAASAYDWYQDGAYLSSRPSFSAHISDTGKYCFMIVARDDFNCVDTAEDCGLILDPHVYIPTAFSPNGDGRNDIFKTIWKDISYAELAVFSRFGERVFVSYDKNVGWDGTYHGKPCDVGVYFYYLKYRILNRPPVYLKGDVTLIR